MWIIIIGIIMCCLHGCCEDSVDVRKINSYLINSYLGIMSDVETPFCNVKICLLDMKCEK